MLMYRGEKRKLSVDMVASLNGATPTGAPTVTIHRARGMEDVSENTLTDDPAVPAFNGTVVEFWVDLATWTEVARLKVRIVCEVSSGERPVEHTVTLLVQ